jgi:hypothetical protein
VEINKLLGKSVQIHLKSGGAFYFKITGSSVVGGNILVTGFDDEGLELTFSVDDIEYIIGG